jgi:hypothetical protein
MTTRSGRIVTRPTKYLTVQMDKTEQDHVILHQTDRNNEKYIEYSKDILKKISSFIGLIQNPRMSGSLKPLPVGRIGRLNCLVFQNRPTRQQRLAISTNQRSKPSVRCIEDVVLCDKKNKTALLVSVRWR